MRWQRPVRFGVALIGIGCAVAIGVYGRRAKRPVIDDTPPVVMADRTISAKTSGVRKYRTNFANGDETIQIEADEETAYTDGRARLERVLYISKRKDGTVFEIRAGLAESQGKAVTGDEPGLINLSGGVHTKNSDGLEITTDSATYDNIQGLATIPGKLTFTRGRLSGEGVGATYDRERDVLWLLDEARVRRAPGPDGTGALDASAKGIGMARPDRYMNLRERARIVQPNQTLSSDQIIVHFTDDESGAELLEMHGTARVTPAASAKKGAPDMQSDDITLEFQEDGQTLRHAMMSGRSRVVQMMDQGRQTISATSIDLVTAADGRTLVNLEATGGDVEAVLPPAADRPERTIRSATLVTSGDETGLKSAVFDGNVTFIESSAPRGARATGGRGATPPASRNATSAELALTLGGQLGAIEKAQFRRNVVFKDGNMTARDADLAEHDEKLGILILTPPTGKLATVDDGTVNVQAEWIQVALNTHDLRAKGRIRVVMAQGKSASGAQTHTPALFDAAKPIRGVATNLKYTAASREAVFVGTPQAAARVYQTEGAGTANEEIKNYITAANIQVNQDSGNLTAEGQVDSHFLLERMGEAGRRGAAPKAAPAKAAPVKGSPAKGAVAEPAPRNPETVVKAAQMVYVDAERKVVYTGSATTLVVLDGPDDDIEAKEIVLTLAPTERALKTLVATGTMAAKFEGGREAVGHRMVYDAVTETHVITGTPMYFKNAQNDGGTRSCSLEQSTELHYEGRDQTINEPAAANLSLRPTLSVACATPLKTVIQTMTPK